MTIYGATVTLTPIGLPAVDISCDVGDVAINHGRGDPATQPDASTATITLPMGLVPDIELGSAVTVTSDAPTNPVRFAGWVSDMFTEYAPQYDPAVGDVMVLPVSRIIAVGPLADTGRRYVGDVPWPQELDGARVGRILAAAGIAGVVGEVDPGTVEVLPRDVDRKSALELTQAVANDAVGVMWESRDGKVNYADADHRHGATIAVTLDACDILLSPRWTRTRSGMVNDVAVTYGVDPGSGGRPVVTDSRPESIAAYGRMAYSVTTELATSDDAAEFAQLLMVRNAEPAWLLEGIQLDLFILDAAKTQAVLALDIHSLLAITGFPEGGPETTVTLWVEGWTEDIRHDEHRLSLFVSAYCRTAPPPTWDEVPPTWTWNTLTADKTWDGATCWGGPLPMYGRWADVPASLRWDAVAASVTWDTWT